MGSPQAVTQAQERVPHSAVVKTESERTVTAAAAVCANLGCSGGSNFARYTAGLCQSALRVVCVASERAFQDRAGPARERAEDRKREMEERKQIRGMMRARRFEKRDNSDEGERGKGGGSERTKEASHRKQRGRRAVCLALSA